MVGLFAALAVVGTAGVGGGHGSTTVPLFTRQTGLTCAQCHVLFGAPVPNFTFTGKKFRMNGYRMPWISERIEAGEVGAISGKRLALSSFPYLTLRYQSVFASRSRTPGATTWNPIISNPTSRLALFTGGAFGDNFGLWTEMYLVPPNGQATGEWGLGMFTFDEYDLRFVKTDATKTLGLAFSNQGIAEVSGFGPWAPGGSQLNRGGLNGWNHPNKGQFFAYGWFKDRVFVSVGASPGQDNLDWARMNYLGQAAYWIFNSDAREMSVNVEWKAGNDDIPLLTNTNISTAANTAPHWVYTDGVTGVSATRTAAASYVSKDLGDFNRVSGELRYGFIDRGPHSIETGLGYNVNSETYADNGKTKLSSFFGRVRYVYDRTYGLDLQVGKNTTYNFTDRTGLKHDIPAHTAYTAYFVFQPQMNIITSLQYSNTTTLRLDQAPLMGKSWSLGIDYLF
ncbi:MAG: hypothetical protein AUH78_13145 [Gemmatimonadetes bacterium 13_1_40CM_4_69_8]|nr:MAG: hypothetical protein AUH78_13145 [Gemmatimonadetes bacterium 13_1_40CM_4_69_8]PYP74186.1 MAG: hypothetical protein DMD41_02895 [Gemmatimonadota bacterium]